jgi:hypothetical protein
MLPPNSTSLNIAPTTRAAAIASYGLVYHSSNLRNQIEKVLVNFEIAEFSDCDTDNSSGESYLSACGFSLVCSLYIGLHCSWLESRLGFY